MVLLLLSACGLSEYNPDAVDDGDDSPGRRDAPVLDELVEYRNEDTVLVTGEAAPGDLIVDLIVKTGEGEASQQVAVIDGVFEVEVDIPRGEVVQFAATNDNGSSNVVSTTACDPWDDFEIDPAMWDTWGDTCDDAIEPVAALRDSESTAQFSANLLEEGDQDWYAITFLDESTVENSAGIENFKASIALSEGAEAYTLEVFNGGCDAEPECQGTYEEYDFFMDDVEPDELGEVPADPRACGDEPLNPCEDWTGTWYVRVSRTDGLQDCTHYTLSVSNGVWE